MFFNVMGYLIVSVLGVKCNIWKSSILIRYYINCFSFIIDAF